MVDSWRSLKLQGGEPKNQPFFYKYLNCSQLQLELQDHGGKLPALQEALQLLNICSWDVRPQHLL